MKSKVGVVILTITATFGAMKPVAVHGQSTSTSTNDNDDDKYTNTTNEQLASYGLTLDEFNKIRTSESPEDFGQFPPGSDGDWDGSPLLSIEETEQLWLDAAVFEYEVATSYSDDMTSSSPSFHPYVVCSNEPGLSGTEREDKVAEAVNNTPDILASHFYTNGNLFHNGEDVACGLIRAYNDTIAKVYAANPDAKEWMVVNPLHSSMKMVEHTVEVLESWFDDESGAKDVVSISGGTNDNDYMEVEVLGLHMILCPGVQDFEVGDVDDERIATDIKNFVIEDGGKTVEKMSFFHHRVSGLDGKDAVRTERMDKWAGTITAVTSWTKDDGSNVCLDNIINENMMFIVKNRIVEVNAKISFMEAEDLAESLGFKEEDMETCIWYLTYALGMNPMICSLEPKTGVTTLCADGTSNLTKCSDGNGGDDVDAGNGNGGNSGGGGGDVSNSSSKIAIETVALMAMLASLLSIAIL